MEYGSLLITVHDGATIQIDRTERRRFDSCTLQVKAAPESSPSGQ